MALKDLLTDKTSAEKADIKATEIAKLNHVGKYTKDDLEVEIVSVEKIEGGVQVLARAWKAGKQLGFGDGTIDIERFRFSNPPTMVPDGTFTQKSFVDPLTKEEIQYDSLNHKEDVMEALRQVLVDTVRRVAKDGANVEPGKVGSTVTTVFATYGASVRNDQSSGTWAAIHDASDGDVIDTTNQRFTARWDLDPLFTMLSRYGCTFDTSGIPDGDTITAATLSIFGDSTTNGNATGNAIALNIYDFNPASTTTYVTGDFDLFGTTEFSTEIVFASWSTSAYNDFILNASGIANISKTGNTVFGARESNFDAPNSSPSIITGGTDQFGYRNYTATGTTNDPKLVVTHAAAGGGASTRHGIALMGVGI